MEFFKKIDFPVQIVLLLLCLLPLAISPMMVMLWMYTLPLLGLWQVISVIMHSRNKQLTPLHKLYIKISGGAILLYFIVLFLIIRKADASIFWTGIFAAFVLALFYLYVTFKTRKL